MQMLKEALPNVELDAESVKAFAAISKRQQELKARQAAVQEFLRTVVQSGEARMTELQVAAQQLHADSQKLWVATKAKYDIDLDHVNYEFDDDKHVLVPTMVRL